MFKALSLSKFATSRSIHTLPTLDYPVSEGIAPCITAKQLDFHYNKHHNTYVLNLNKLVAGTRFETSPLDKIITETAYDAKTVAIFNNAAQHFNHSFYWKCMKPNTGDSAKAPQLVAKIVEQWGSFDKFQEEFTQKSVTFFGSGWCWLVLDGASLTIWTGGNAQCPITENKLPILTCDVWEHAYYLDHQNRRAEYLEKFWKVVNWEFCEKVFSDNIKVAKILKK